MKKEKSKSYKISRYTFYYKINKKIGAFYNSLNMGVIFGVNEFFKKILETRNNIKLNSMALSKNEKLSLRKLISEGFVIEKNENDDEERKYDQIRQKSIKLTPLIAMYIILTENCNFRCHYCAFFANLPKDYKSQLMTKEIADKALDLFLKYCSKFKKYKCDVGISTTVASHNINSLPSTIEYFKNRLDPINIGLNPLHLITSPKKEPWAIALEKSVYGMLRAFEEARKLGIYIEQIMRRIRPFIERTPRIKDCPSCGGLIRFYPSGKYGPCGHLVSMGKNCLSISENMSWVKSGLRKKWSERSSFNMGKECKFCPTVSICGGGCPFSAYKRYGDIMDIDDRMCVQSKIFLKWLIKDLYEIIKPNFKREKILVYTPSQEERRKTYGKINVFDEKLPLQNYSKFGEIYE